MEAMRKHIDPGQLVTVDGEAGILLTQITWIRSNVKYENSETVEVVEHPSPFFVQVLVGDKRIKTYASSVVPVQEP